MISYLIQHSLRIVKHESIDKPQHKYIKMGQKQISLIIINSRSRIKMRLSVQFNRQPLRGTVKVKNVIAKTMLSPESASVKLFIFKIGPHLRFSRRKMAPQSPPKSLQLWPII